MTGSRQEALEAAHVLLEMGLPVSVGGPTHLAITEALGVPLTSSAEALLVLQALVDAYDHGNRDELDEEMEREVLLAEAWKRARALLDVSGLLAKLEGPESSRPNGLVREVEVLIHAAREKPGPGSIVCVPCGSVVNSFLEYVPGKLPNGDVCTHRTGKVGKHPTARRMIPRDTTP